jgi:hypothetical protein
MAKKTKVISTETDVTQAEAWWDDLSENERDHYRPKFQNGYAPTDDELVAAYGERDTTSGSEDDPEVELQHTGDEPPVASPATPGASATNPELMANDPPDGTPLYDLPPGIPAYVPPEPPPEGGALGMAYTFTRGEPADDHQTKLREIEAKEAEEAQRVADLKAKHADEKSKAFRKEERERQRRKAESEEYVS